MGFAERSNRKKCSAAGGRWTGSDRASHPLSGSKAKAITRAEHSHDFNYAHNILHMNTLVRSVFGSTQTGGVSWHSQRQPPIRGPKGSGGLVKPALLTGLRKH